MFGSEARGARLRPALAPRGFSVVELIIALTVGVLVLGGAIGYLVQEMRNLTGGDIRQHVARNGRFIGTSLRHDLQRAGVEIKSTTRFGTVATWPGSRGDTLVLLHVPYRPDIAPAHPIAPPPGSENPLPAGGTCGPRCIEVVRDPDVELALSPGDLARLQVVETRRLILIADLVETSDTSVALTFTEAESLLRQPAGLADDLRLDRFSTFVQKLIPVIYYLNDQGQLERAVRLNLDGSPRGDVLAYDVERFDVKLVFEDGDELERADPEDEDDTNDFDDIVAVRIVTVVTADRVDPRVNEGQLLRRTYQWVIAPRNLRYEKARL